MLRHLGFPGKKRLLVFHQGAEQWIHHDLLHGGSNLAVAAANGVYKHLWSVELIYRWQNGEIYLAMLDEQGLSLYIYV